jgi:hypothetical protein
MVVHACNSSTWEVEDLEFEASLDYIARSCLKKKKQKKPNNSIYNNIKNKIKYLVSAYDCSSMVKCLTSMQKAQHLQKIKQST